MRSALVIEGVYICLKMRTMKFSPSWLSKKAEVCVESVSIPKDGKEPRKPRPTWQECSLPETKDNL
jgi:hypothetical protein